MLENNVAPTLNLTDSVCKRKHELKTYFLKKPFLLFLVFQIFFLS